MTQKIQKIKELVEQELRLSKDSTHDIDHVMRVYNLALTIAKTEPGANLDIIKIASLLHDIGGAKESSDPSGMTDHAVVGAMMAKQILEGLDFSGKDIKHIQACILSHRYRTGYRPETIEAKIVYDADKLDASGAIGIARAFAWVGKHNAKIYKHPESMDEYIRTNLMGASTKGRIMDKSQHSVQINYETKDKFLVEGLYTASAKKIGQERLIFFKDFLDRMEREVVGEL